MTRIIWAVCASTLVFVACGNGKESSGDGDGDTTDGGDGDAGDGDAGDGDGDTTGGGATPVPGVSEEGWSSDYSDDGAGAGCEGDAASFSHLPQVTVGGSTLYVGFEQVGGNNQDPIFARFDDGELVYCKYHEDDGPDGRALGVTWDGGEHAYVVYTVVGGGSDLEGKDGWLSAYAPGAISGGGPKVSYVGRVNVETGELVSGTFIIAVLMSNKVNSHSPAGPVTVLEGGHVEFLGGSAHKPIDADGKSWMDCTDYPFDTKYVFSADLSELICAESSNCVSQKPCE